MVRLTRAQITRSYHELMLFCIIAQQSGFWRMYLSSIQFRCRNTIDACRVKWGIISCDALQQKSLLRKIEEDGSNYSVFDLLSSIAETTQSKTKSFWLSEIIICYNPCVVQQPSSSPTSFTNSPDNIGDVVRSDSACFSTEKRTNLFIFQFSLVD